MLRNLRKQIPSILGKTKWFFQRIGARGRIISFSSLISANSQFAVQRNHKSLFFGKASLFRESEKSPFSDVLQKLLTQFLSKVRNCMSIDNFPKENCSSLKLRSTYLFTSFREEQENFVSCESRNF